MVRYFKLIGNDLQVLQAPSEIRRPMHLRKCIWILQQSVLGLHASSNCHSSSHHHDRNRLAVGPVFFVSPHLQFFRSGRQLTTTESGGFAFCKEEFFFPVQTKSIHTGLPCTFCTFKKQARFCKKNNKLSISPPFSLFFKIHLN